MTTTIQKLTPTTHPELLHLWNVPGPPSEIYVQGLPKAFELLKTLPTHGLAIVGTRRPQTRSIRHLHTVIQDLKGSPLIIVSGFAKGIDQHAHQYALDAGLPTIAVLAHGFDHCYPAEHLSLGQEILKAGGLLMTEFPPDEAPISKHFLRRNRLIAGWTQATWVVEASYRSGALNTARWARDQEKTCLTTPCFPGDVAFAGNQILLERDQAVPLFSPLSLGCVWIEFINKPTLSSKHQPSLPLGHKYSDHDLLFRQIDQICGQKDGAEVFELLEWSLSNGWTPTRFFETFKSLLALEKIEDQKGKLFPMRGLKSISSGKADHT